VVIPPPRLVREELPPQKTRDEAFAPIQYR